MIESGQLPIIPKIELFGHFGGIPLLNHYFGWGRYNFPRLNVQQSNTWETGTSFLGLFAPVIFLIRKKTTKKNSQRISVTSHWKPSRPTGNFRGSRLDPASGQHFLENLRCLTVTGSHSPIYRPEIRRDTHRKSQKHMGFHETHFFSTKKIAEKTWITLTIVYGGGSFCWRRVVGSNKVYLGELHLFFYRVWLYVPLAHQKKKQLNYPSLSALKVICFKARKKWTDYYP